MMENRVWRGHLPVSAAFLVLVSLLLVATAPPAQAAKFAGAFMEDGGGARALGMGGAFAAVADDPTATFWNPAGLSRTESRELFLMHDERFGDLVDRDFASFVAPVNWSLLGGEDGGVGLTVIRLGVDDIPFTEHLLPLLDDNEDGVVDNDELLDIFQYQDQIRFKSDQEFAVMASYGERKGAWLLGGTIKVIRQSVGDHASLGIGADLGLLRPGIWGKLDFGLKLQDITTTYLSWDTGHNEVIYPAVVPGLAYNIPFTGFDMNLLLAGSMELRVEDRGGADQFEAGDFSGNGHLGAEVSFSQKVFLRGGFNSGFAWEDATAGAGFRINPLTVDYAYAGDVMDADKASHRVSLSVRF
jgi:hypothetical protein